MFGLLDILFALLLLCISTGVSLLITVPFYGTLVRFRANYTPKGLALDGEGGVQPHVGPVVTGYFQMAFRVKRIEGFAGLYKGIMPIAISSILITLFTGLWIGASMVNSRGRYSVPAGGSFQLLVYTLVVAIISIPMTVIIHRTITTPHKLPTWNPVSSLLVLLTPYERSRPWVLFLTPGLVVSQGLHILYVLLVLNTFRRLLLPSSFLDDASWSDENGKPLWPADFTVLRFSLYFLITSLSTIVLCPLEVIGTRLSLQRNHAPEGGFTAVSQDERAMGIEEEIEFAGSEEDVIGLRSEEDPYTGFVDCAKRIVAEEGIRVLLRGWWITLLGGVFSTIG
ncbi:mitochondrial carrier [Exidia glandulosa HHB12029]|uniref:Mitochondrial carrier n=1 Tax=Exidia glandulosa HHB12029 TaxID=1314781 RepID=A0A165F2R3_EXIGL|nr:mitochondrial carrier [Exidia glandulosa HHB12029]